MKKTLPLTLLLLVAPVVSRAQVLQLNVTATTVSHQFTPASEALIDAYAQDWLWGGFWGAAPAESFTANLSAYEKL